MELMKIPIAGARSTTFAPLLTFNARQSRYNFDTHWRQIAKIKNIFPMREQFLRNITANYLREKTLSGRGYGAK